MTDSDGTAAAPAAVDPISAPLPKQAEDKLMLPPASSPGPAARSGILSIWPPSQRTRDAVISRLIETLSTPSVLSKRYGTITTNEAAEAARRIEEEAFAASSSSTTSPEDDGLEILQQYSKEISKRMLETVKARARSDTASNNVAPATTSPVDVALPADSAAEEAPPASDQAAA
ncbi:unnamed protein product [Linum tenue]|uniref:WPP domain-containing protein n=1 Tax=Linum tenue TaxID=586396 RepID=A0AAV0KST9_9ROSI|nr:unnamed protein product [Linum tenue]